MELKVSEDFMRQMKMKREQFKKQQGNYIRYRDDDGEIKVSYDMSLLDKFNQEREDRLAEIPSIKFEDLIAHFMSKKLYSKITEPRPLSKLEPDPDPEYEQEKVAITSYSRSGNTLTRAFFQRLTGIVTGSEGELRHVQSRDLFQKGMWGECLVDDRVWGIKTHYPGAVDPDGEGRVHKAILCVRNPIDTLVSLYQFQISGQHHEKIEERFFTDFKEDFSKYVRQEVLVWQDYYKFWLNVEIPICIIRYEDMLTRPYETFSGVMKLLLNTKSIEGRAAQKYVELVAKEKAPQVYSVKSEKKKQCEHLHRFSKEDQAYIYEQCRELIELFGYEYIFTGAPEPENPRAFIDQFNEKKLQQAIKMDEEGTMISMSIHVEENCVRYPNATRKFRAYGQYLENVVKEFNRSKAMKKEQEAQEKLQGENKEEEEKQQK